MRLLIDCFQKKKKMLVCSSWKGKESERKDINVTMRFSSAYHITLEVRG